jgi:HTH-type transcriptional regulator, glycine betaine synthesis regulator
VSPEPYEPYELWPSQVLVADAVGRLMAFWGFKHNMGRIWATLYLSERPLTARDLKEGLGISVGSVSMTLSELEQWGVAHQTTTAPRSRSKTYAAQTDLWKMITRVLRDRERVLITDARHAFAEALAHVRNRARSPDPAIRARARVQEERIKLLLDLTRLGGSLLDALVETGRVDMSPLGRSLLRRDKK